VPEKPPVEQIASRKLASGSRCDDHHPPLHWLPVEAAVQFLGRHLAFTLVEHL
jgi:hypothetical protein